MLKITNGQHNLTVTMGAYRNFYRGLGYEPVEALEEPENLEQGSTHSDDKASDTDHSDDKASDTDHSDDKASDTDHSGTEDLEEDAAEDSDEGEETPLSEVPLSEMTLSQLLSYAEELGLEYEGTPNRKELRKLIRDHLK